MKVFFSSTFTDTYRERDALLSEVLPKLRERARSENIEVSFVDMRWGIRDENTLDHRTWVECKREIVRCFEDSWGCFFVSLQSEKYGYTPLPRTIDAAVFEERLQQPGVQQDEEAVALSRQWYYLDDNAVPQERVLRNLEKMDDDAYWKAALPRLLRLLDGVTFDGGLLVGSSVTEWEVRTALELELQRDTSRLFWMRRVFSGGVSKEQDRYWDFNDTLTDETKAVRMQRLIDYMEGEIPAGGLRTLTKANMESYCSGDEAWEAQKYLWVMEMRERLGASLEEIIRMRAAWNHDGCGLGVAGDEAAEMLHHATFAARKVQDFEGREGLVQEALAHVYNSSGVRTKDAQRPESSLSCIALSIIGRSGSGKTALMAKLADCIARAEDGGVGEVAEGDLRRTPRCVIVRFCGTSPGSTAGLALVRSISRQIHLVLGHNLDDSINVLSMEYKDAVAHLQQLLHDYPVVLMIDSLDQLSNADLARSDISFLKGAHPHPQTRIIVSTLPDEKAQDGSGVVQSYFFGCETMLRAHRVPRVEVAAFNVEDTVAPDAICQPMNEANEARRIMDVFLAKKARRLTEEQWAFTMQQVAVELTALYLRLAVRVVERWTSALTTEELALNAGVTALIGQIFDTLERDYGRELTRAALGFLSFAVEGVTDEEMCDLLSLHADVMSCVNQYNEAPRLPMHVWLRLRGDLTGLISERMGGCLQFYHRQLWETAKSRYCVAEKRVLWRLMARYFGNMVPAEERESKSITSQPLLLGLREVKQIWRPESKELVNRRRVVEAASHMLNIDMVEEAEEELCSLEGVYARCLCNQIVELASQLRYLSKYAVARAGEYSRWVTRDMHVIAKSPISLWFQALAQPVQSVVYKDAIELWNDSRFQPCEFWAANSFHRRRAFGQSTGYDPCLQALVGHRGWVYAAIFSPDGSQIASCSKDKTICFWDPATGMQTSTLEGHTDAVTSLCFSSDGSRIVSGSQDRSVRVWDCKTGAELLAIRNQDQFVDASISADGSRIISAWGFRTINVYNLETGALLLTLEGLHQVFCVRFSPDGSRIAMGCQFVTVLVYDSTTGKRLHRLCDDPDDDQDTDDCSQCKCVCFSPDGSRIAAGYTYNNLTIWDTVTGSELVCLYGHRREVCSVNFSSDGLRLVSTSRDESMRIWDAMTGDQIGIVDCRSYSCYYASFSPDNSLLVSAGQLVQLWDVAAVSEQLHGDLDLRNSNDITDVVVSPDGSRIVTRSGQNTSLWCSTTLLPIVELKKVGEIAMNSDRSQLACRSAEPLHILVMDTMTGSISTFKGHTDTITVVTFSPDGLRIATGSCDKTVRLWDSWTGAQLHVLDGHEREIQSIEFSPDGSFLMSSCSIWDRSSRLWDCATGTLVSYYTFLYLSPDGSRMITSSGLNDFKLHLRDVKSGALICVHEGHSALVAVASITLDGTRVITADDNRTNLWDGSTGALLLRFPNSKRRVSSLAFVCNGSRVISTPSVSGSGSGSDCINCGILRRGNLSLLCGGICIHCVGTVIKLA